MPPPPAGKNQEPPGGEVRPALREVLPYPPGVNVWIAGWLVDAVWFEQKVVVELDSRTAHSTSRAIEHDHRRDLDLRAAGYTVLRYTWQQVTETPELIVGDLRRALRL